MSEADFTVMVHSLDAASVRRGVTTGIVRPPHGGNFVYGFNSVVNTAGGVALYVNQAHFTPIDATKGGSVRSAIQRGVSGGPLNFAPFLFACATSNDLYDARGYMLGLDDDDPHRVVLAKGLLQNGLPALPAGSGGILAAGTETFLAGTWLHLRLDVIANTNGDVILQAMRNDLALHGVDAPQWEAIPGIGTFVDDTLGVNSGTVPLQGGYLGFGFVAKEVSRRAYFDQFEAQRQI